MKKVNFSKPVTNLEGEPMKQGKEVMMINKIMGNMLSMAKAEKEPTRQLDIALKIYNSKGIIELDDSDIEMIKKVIQASNSTALVAGQLFKILNKKEDKKQK